MDTWSMAEFIEFNKKNKDQGLYNSRMDMFLEVINSNFFMKNLHDVLWKFEKDYGSPNIRWSIEGQDLSGFNSGKHRRSYYNPLTNTINLAAETISLDFSEDFIAEISHAKQFHEKPVSSYVMATTGHAKTLYSSITSNTDYQEEYFKLYDQKGTLEYEAHDIIEEQIRKEALIEAAKDHKKEYERTHKNGEK
jgi:hypothetical protein